MTAMTYEVTICDACLNGESSSLRDALPSLRDLAEIRQREQAGGEAAALRQQIETLKAVIDPIQRNRESLVEWVGRLKALLAEARDTGDLHTDLEQRIDKALEGYTPPAPPPAPGMSEERDEIVGLLKASHDAHETRDAWCTGLGCDRCVEFHQAIAALTRAPAVEQAGERDHRCTATDDVRGLSAELTIAHEIIDELEAQLSLYLPIGDVRSQLASSGIDTEPIKQRVRELLKAHRKRSVPPAASPPACSLCGFRWCTECGEVPTPPDQIVCRACKGTGREDNIAFTPPPAPPPAPGMTTCQHGVETTCRDCGMLRMGFTPAPSPAPCGCREQLEQVRDDLRGFRRECRLSESDEALVLLDAAEEAIDAALAAPCGEWELHADRVISGETWFAITNGVSGNRYGITLAADGDRVLVYRRKAKEAK